MGLYRYFGIFVCYRTGSGDNSEKLSDCVKVAKIPVSNIHKNSAELAYVLCGKYVYDEWK